MYGLDVSTSAAPGRDPVAYAQHAESLGFDFVSASDHPSGTRPTYETWTMLTWIAAKTQRIGIATRVLGVPYRNVAMVAKMAETLDRLTDGRLILGLGGGYSDDEFRAFGIPVPSPRDKIDGLEEAVTVIRGLWSQQSFAHSGRIHRTDAAELEPKPSRRIPIWLGTFGPRALSLTGRMADGWIPSLGHAPPAQVKIMRDAVMSAAAGAGRSPDDVTCAYNLVVRIDENAEPRPDAVIGHPDSVAETLLSFIDAGFTSMNFSVGGEDVYRQTERLATEVLPHLRNASDAGLPHSR